MNPLLPHLAKSGSEADRLLDAFNLLLRECLDPESPHEFEPVEVIGIHGKLRPAKRFPAEWSRWLTRAAETRAFRRLELQQVVERILITEAPDA